MFPADFSGADHPRNHRQDQVGWFRSTPARSTFPRPVRRRTRGSGSLRAAKITGMRFAPHPTCLTESHQFVHDEIFLFDRWYHSKLLSDSTNLSFNPMRWRYFVLILGGCIL